MHRLQRPAFAFLDEDIPRRSRRVFPSCCRLRGSQARRPARFACMRRAPARRKSSSSHLPFGRRHAVVFSATDQSPSTWIATALYFFLPAPKLGCHPEAFWLGAAAMVLIFSFLGFLASRLPRCSPLAMPISLRLDDAVRPAIGVSAGFGFCKTTC